MMLIYMMIQINSPETHSRASTVRLIIHFKKVRCIFIIMDNIDYLGRSEDTGRPQYRGYFSETHLEWIENVLNFVPDDKLIVLASHLPLYGMEHDRGNINTLNREKLFALLEGYNNVLYLGGHRHLTYHHFLGEEFGRNNPNKLHHMRSAMLLIGLTTSVSAITASCRVSIAGSSASLPGARR